MTKPRESSKVTTPSDPNAWSGIVKHAKPPQSNKTFALVMDIIYQWLIKNGLEVSEEAKDELETKIKEQL